MLSINTNISDLILQRTLLDSTNGLNEAISRMTTGYKVNHAKDNAANYSIIEDLNTRISSMLQVQNNTEDGISLLSMAEGGLDEIHGLLQRLRELTIQASNGSYDSTSRASMQAEADAILEEITRIRSSINYDGMNLYETPNNGAVSRLAQSARINTATAGVDISNTASFTPTPAVIFNAGDASNTSPAFYSSSTSLAGEDVALATGGVSTNTPRAVTPSQSSEVNSSSPLMRTMMRSASPAATTIDGAVDFTANETKIVNIDGVNYEITNEISGTNTLSYSKDTTTGQITLLGNNFAIVGQSDKAHNLYIDGNYLA